MKPHPFASELQGLPPDVAAELEDHLMESFEAGLRSGLTPQEARAAALRSLGMPAKIWRECDRAVAAAVNFRGGLGWALRSVASGWLALGALFATRACEASDPSHASIGCIGILTCTSVAVAVAIRCWGGRWAWPLAAWSWGLGTAAVIGLASAGAHPWLQDGMALSPMLLGAVGLFGAASGAFLVSARRPPPSLTNHAAS